MLSIQYRLRLLRKEDWAAGYCVDMSVIMESKHCPVVLPHLLSIHESIQVAGGLVFMVNSQLTLGTHAQ